MSEQAVEERRGWASDIVWVVVYSILVLLVMLLWVVVPAYKTRRFPAGSRWARDTQRARKVGSAPLAGTLTYAARSTRSSSGCKQWRVHSPTSPVTSSGIT